MGKIRKKRRSSLKWSLFWYIPICAILAYIGAYAIGIATNYLQDWYREKFFDIDFHPQDGQYEVIMDEDGTLQYSFYKKEQFSIDELEHYIIYLVISWTQVILIPAWVLFCVVITGIIFYKRELEKPIVTLMKASKMIEENYLDFRIECETASTYTKVAKENFKCLLYSGKQNELGQLCQAFENMRMALYQQNQNTWRMLEERKWLNAAFSHDMRTPITVLKGYTDLLTQHISDGKISEEKLMQILGMMSGQIIRLERYTQKMSAVQKLEDITPTPISIDWNSFEDKCKSISDIFKEEKQVYFTSSSDMESFMLDEELVLEVYENLLSNAVRYAKSEIKVTIIIQEGLLQLLVEDDGKGFSEDALRYATTPFFREEEKNGTHFGLGLYICKLLCEKYQGTLSVENGTQGGKVKAIFLLYEVISK